jgi:hypothetical protein
MMKKAFVTIEIFVLIAALLLFIQMTSSISRKQEGFFPIVSMPIEYINYTIKPLNGTLWAQIDGYYPIHILNHLNSSSVDLPMVYPMPPGTTNIQVKLNEKEVHWSNYTDTNPEFTHKTAIGDWWMIQTTLTDISEFFVLKIHYEHPLQKVNASYIFLYDLNISPYLNPQIRESTANFTLQFYTNITNFKAYTALPETSADSWKPLNHNITNEGSKITIIMHSEYNKPLAGDLVVTFSEIKCN